MRISPSVPFGATATGDVNRPTSSAASSSDTGTVLPRSTCFAIHSDTCRASPGSKCGLPSSCRRTAPSLIKPNPYRAPSAIRTPCGCHAKISAMASPSSLNADRSTMLAAPNAGVCTEYLHPALVASHILALTAPSHNGDAPARFSANGSTNVPSDRVLRHASSPDVATSDAITSARARDCQINIGTDGAVSIVFLDPLHVPSTSPTTIRSWFNNAGTSSITPSAMRCTPSTAHCSSSTAARRRSADSRPCVNSTSSLSFLHSSRAAVSSASRCPTRRFHSRCSLVYAHIDIPIVIFNRTLCPASATTASPGPGASTAPSAPLAAATASNDVTASLRPITRSNRSMLLSIAKPLLTRSSTRPVGRGVHSSSYTTVLSSMIHPPSGTSIATAMPLLASIADSANRRPERVSSRVAHHTMLANAIAVSDTSPHSMQKSRSTIANAIGTRRTLLVSNTMST